MKMSDAEFIKDWIKRMGEYAPLTIANVTDYINKRETKNAATVAEPSDEAASYKRMFEDAVRSLAAIDEALGIDPDEAGGAEPILQAIEELKAAQQQAEPVGDERAAFEGWAFEGYDLARHPEGPYKDRNTASAYAGWTAYASYGGQREIFGYMVPGTFEGDISPALVWRRGLKEATVPVYLAAQQTAQIGDDEVQRVLNRLNSSDPEFDDCADAAALIVRMAAEMKGPDGFATWKDAAIAARAAQSGQRAGVADGHTNTVYEAAQKLRSLAADLPDAWLRDEFAGIADQIANLCQMPPVPSPHSTNVIAGWKLVPIEPTDEMLNAGSICHHLNETWAQMLAAAPTQQQERSDE